PKDLPETEAHTVIRAAAPVAPPTPVALDTPPVERAPVITAQAGGLSTTPDFRGMSRREVLEESTASGLLVEVQGSGLARSQEPAPGTILSPRTRVRVQFGK